MRSSAGFSLIEVMCAIMVLGIGVVGLTLGLTTALTASKESERQTVAALLAAGQMETLRADAYLVEGEDEGDGYSELSNYRWRQSVVKTSTDGLYEVRIVVEIAETGQVVYQLVTLLFDPPVYSTLEDAGEERRPRKERL